MKEISIVKYLHKSKENFQTTWRFSKSQVSNVRVAWKLLIQKLPNINTLKKFKVEVTI